MDINFSSRPTKIRIQLSNLAHNLAQARKRAGTAKIMAVVKANAYGHGLAECGLFFEKSGADFIGVALLEEGEALRKAGVTCPVHVFGGILGEQIERYIAADLDLTASSIDKLKTISEVANSLGKQARVHVKIDTGMGRIGIRPETFPSMLELATTLKGIKYVGIFSHFAEAEMPDTEFTQQQLSAFKQVVALAKSSLGEDIIAHFANSAALINLPQSYYDMVRPGLLLYGVAPDASLVGRLDLRPALSVTSKVVYFKVVKKGQSVSYGRTWIASKDSRIITVPIGYGDGYPRALSNKSKVLIRGKKYSVVGRICMDQMMIDVSGSEVFNADDVVLIGNSGDSSITVEELAIAANTIPHEILSSLNLRLPREFI